MLNNIAKYIIHRLNGTSDNLNAPIALPYADVVAGIVTRAGFKTDKGTIYMPFVCGTDEATCQNMAINPITPNLQKKGVLYFEKGETLGMNKVSDYGGTFCNFKLTLVHWYNKKKLGKEACDDLTFQFLTEIKRKVPQDVEVLAVGDCELYNILIYPEKITYGSDCFKKYSYSSIDSILYAPPFESYAVTFQVSFSFNPKCLPPLEVGEGEDCECYF